MSASLTATVPTRFLDVGDTRFAYRRFGTPAGTPLVFTQHFMGNLDNFDPAIADALAAGRRDHSVRQRRRRQQHRHRPKHGRGHSGRCRQLHRWPRPVNRRHPRSLYGRRGRPIGRARLPEPDTPPRARRHRPTRRGRDSQAGARCRPPLRQAGPTRGGYVAAHHVLPVEREPGGRPRLHLPHHGAHRRPGHSGQW